MINRRAVGVQLFAGLTAALSLAACGGSSDAVSESTVPTTVAAPPTASAEATASATATPETAAPETVAPDTTAPPTAAPETTAPAPTSADSATASTGGAVAGDMTAPGTELAIGDTATVEYPSTDAKAPISIQVTGIDAGTNADLAPLELGSDADGFTPYYIRVTVTGGAGADALANTSFDRFSGYLDDGGPAAAVIYTGEFAPCQSQTSFPKDFADGQTFETCVISASPDTRTVASVKWRRYNTPYEQDPITWK